MVENVFAKSGLPARNDTYPPETELRSGDDHHERKNCDFFEHGVFKNGVEKKE
jgi:hypothetical protein